MYLIEFSFSERKKKEKYTIVAFSGALVNFVFYFISNELMQFF